MTSLKERQRALREEVIVETAHTMLAQHGYEAMSMDEVAAQVGISKATLYQHFPSKEELAISVIVRLISFSLNDLREIYQSQAPALERLERCLRTGLERRTQFWTAHLTLPTNVVERHPRYCQKMDEMTTMLEDLIERAKQDGSVNPALSTPVIVRMAISLFRADFARLLAEHKCTADELISTLVSIVINGVKTSN
jgi:AcrR family transcriptional regulator